MTTRFTPGPWHACIDDSFADDLRVEGIYAADGERIVETDSGVYPPRLADAYLIAAAPEMYAACKAFIDHRSRVFDAQMRGRLSEIPSGRINEVIDAIEAALAKAEGRQA